MRNIPKGYKKQKNRIIPQDWNFVKISSILQKVGNKVKVSKEENYQQIGIRSHGRGLFYKETVTGEELGSKSVFWIEKDCFIVNIVFAWEQAVGRTTENEVGMICSHRFPMYSPIGNKVDVDYLIYIFKTSYGKKVLELASPGGAGRNKTLGQKEFANSEILIPSSIEEQKEIKKILFLWDSAIEKQEQLIEKKKEFKKGLMQRLLSGEVRFKEFKDKWIVAKLGILFNERKETGYNNLELLAITTANGVVRRTEVDIKDSSSEDKSKYKRILPGDIGYNTMRMWQGVSGLSKYEGIVSPAYTILKPTNKVNSTYMSYLFKFPSIINLFYRYSQGLVRDTLNLKYENFKDIKVSIPLNVKEQEKIAEVLIGLDKEIELLQKELEVLKLQKKGLMQRLLTGEVRVKV